MPHANPGSGADPTEVASVAFDRFELRPDDRLLLRDGEPVVLRAKAFDLLSVLVERAGRLVSKSELLDRVWPGLVVEENNIAAQVAALRKVVGGELVVTVPGSGYRFVGEVRRLGGPAASDAATAAVVPPAPPPPTFAAPTLFGRDADLRAVSAALGAGGCVTLAGAGGVGKTVLARAVAADVSARTAQRVAWVDLAALDDGAEVAAAVCRALGIATPASAGERQAALVAALRDGRALLVLDNAEHLVHAVAELCAGLGVSLPGVAILVTSQLPLRVAGEHVHALEPLALPAEGLAGDAALASAAVQMLLARIRAVDARLPIGAEALPLLRSLCVRLDGLPLAIEMAASVVPLLGLGGVLAALDRRFDALRRGQREAPARHRTLRGALEWSHALLTPEQQRVFRRLGVFASSFSLELAVDVAADPGEDRWDAVDTFSELVDRSLVASLRTDPPRYRLLETVRSFALEALDAAPDGDAAATRGRAVRALAAAMARSDPSATAPSVAELPNVPEMLQWARAHDAEAALDLALAAASVATWTPWLAEAARWVEACEPLLGGLSPARQAAWWRELARFQTFVRGPRTVEAARRAAEIERGLGNADGLFWSLVPLLRSRVIEPDQFEAVRGEAEALLDRHPDWPARARAVFAGSLALEYRRRGDFETALVHQQAEAEAARRAGLHQLARNARSNVAATLNGLGRFESALAILDAASDAQAEDDAAGAAEDPVVAHDFVQRLNALLGLGRLDEAEAVAPAALASGRRFGVLDVLQVLARLQATRGRMRSAAMSLGHYRQALAERGAELPEDDHAPWRDAQRRVDAALGPEAAQALVERGAGLAVPEADAFLLDTGEPPARSGSP